MSVVVDSHALIWYLDEPSKLSSAAERALDEAIKYNAHFLYLSSISLVEICYLIEKNRVKQKVLTRILSELDTSDAVLIEVAVTRVIFEALANIPRAVVPDMPDRIIAATALHLGLPLVTRDGKIRASNIVTIW